MPTSVRKGILLEQNKEPMLSREIVRLSECDAAAVPLPRGIPTAPEFLAPHEIIATAKEAQVVDEVDGQKLWKKLAHASREGIGSVVVDALDDEPYISSQLGPALWFQKELAQGVALLKRSVGTGRAHVEVYQNLFDIDKKIPRAIDSIKVRRVGGTYPAEGRVQHLARRERAVVVGACAVIALWRAAYRGMRHTTCFVTVAGDCIAYPANYEVPIGMTAARLLEKAGLVADPRRLIAGGSMTGFAISDPGEAAITPTTRGILAFSSEFRDLGFTCIGCGRCTGACPQGLSPYYIHKLVHSHRHRYLEMFDVDRCTGCGTCSYVCPAKLDLAQAMSQGAEIMARRSKGGDL